MTLFGRQDSNTKSNVNPPTPTSDPVAKNTSRRRSGLFGSLHSPKQTSPVRTTTSTSSVQSNGSTKSPKTGLLHREIEDASITAARNRVMSAESAERDADKALLMARSAVREAREHVKKLEKEATEQARLAQIKQKQAANISARAKPLGRHDHVSSS